MRRAKKKEILLIDVGNTSTLFAWSDKRRFYDQTRLATSKLSVSSLSKVFPPHRVKSSEGIVLSSVVPEATRKIKTIFLKQFGKKFFVVGQNLKIPIKNRYKNPKQVGADRLMNAVAVHARFPTQNVIVLDFGTAITLDAVTARGEYLGGIIAPGIEIALDALFERTALLPRTKLSHVSLPFGRNTAQSIQVGCTQGIGGLCDRLVSNLKRFLGTKTVVVATGGYAGFLRPYCHSIGVVDPDLVLKGILRTYLLK